MTHPHTHPPTQVVIPFQRNRKQSVQASQKEEQRSNKKNRHCWSWDFHAFKGGSFVESWRSNLGCVKILVTLLSRLSRENKTSSTTCDSIFSSPWWHCGTSFGPVPFLCLVTGRKRSKAVDVVQLSMSSKSQRYLPGRANT